MLPNRMPGAGCAAELICPTKTQRCPRPQRAYFLVFECAHCKGFKRGGILATDSSLSPVATQMKRFVASGHDL